MKKSILLSLPLLFGLALALAWLSAAHPKPARADPGNLFVTPGGGGDCSQASPCGLPAALSAAGDGDAIYLAAGTYTGAGQAVITLAHSVSIYGGWDGAPAGAPARSPEAYPSTVDGQGQRRGIFIAGPVTVTLEGLTIANGKIISTTATGWDGAGLYARDTYLTLRHMNFYSNVVDVYDAADSIAYGGGARVEGGTLQIDTSTFRANSVWARQSCYGGGLSIFDTLTASVENSLFQDNDAWHASGLNFWGYDRPPLAIRGSRFVDNGWGNSPGDAAGGYSGAMQISNAQARLEDNRIEHNSFVNGWGAISVFHSNLLLSRNVISGNVAHSDASGLYLDNLSAPFTLTNNLIVDNQSTYGWRESACVQIRDSAGQMLHNTIARNANTYGIMVEDGASVALTNTILVSHTVGITVAAGSAASLEATLWGNSAWANATDWGGAGDIVTGAINLWQAPGFLNPTGGDYHLTPGSAAIDAGVDAGVSDDFEGDPRPLDGSYDIGADEWAFIWRVYLPLVMR